MKSIKTNPFRRPRFFAVARVVFTATLLAQTVTADVGMRLKLWQGYGNFYGSVDMTTPSPAPVTYHRIESPNGLLWEETGSGANNATTNLGSFAALMDECTNGLWTLTLNVGDVSQAVYTFSVDISGVTPGLFGSVNVTEPVNYSTITNNPPTIQWTSTSALPEVDIQIVEDNPPYGFQGQVTLPGTTTNWTPAAPLSQNDQRIFLRYQANDFSGFTFSTPTNVIGGAVAPGWTAAGDLWSYTFSYFTVGGGGGSSELGNAVDAPELAWTTGGDKSWFAQDYEYLSGTNAAASDLYGYSSAESWIETTVQGPGSLDFSWGIDADENDFLTVEVDGYEEDAIYEYDLWSSGGVYISDTGPVTVRWTFYHFDDNDVFSSAYLDGVTYYPEPPDYNTEMSLKIQRAHRDGNTHYVAFPQLLYAYPDPVTTHEVESPNGLFSGGEGTSSSTHMPSLDALIDECTNGMWTLYFNRYSPYEEQYTFSMSALSISTNDFPPVEILNPLEGAIGVTTDPTYQWSGPPNFDQLYVYVSDDEAPSTVGSSFLPAASTSWTAPTLAGGTNTFTATYTSNNFLGLVITEPSGGYPLSYWDATIQISTMADATFVSTTGFVPMPVTLLPPMITGGNLTFGFTSQSGATHSVECTTNLISGLWVPVTNFPGDGLPALLALPTTNSAAFYRVQTQ